MKLRVAHTPDADDAFMFYAMVEGKIPLSFEIEHFTEDIETLNRMAFEEDLDVTALSLHAYAYLDEKYRILSAGASVGNGYGPIVVAKRETDLEGKKIAIPGRFTTAYLYLRLAIENFEPIEMRFDKIMEAVKRGEADAGLLIHEGQITYKDHGLVKVLDLWDWWFNKTRLPMPLGVNVISRKLSEEIQRKFLEDMKKSIEYALNHPDEAARYAMRYSRGMDFEKTKRFAMMYVNEYTYEMPEDVVKAMEKLFEMSSRAGITKKPRLDIL